MDYKKAGVDIEAGLQISRTYERACKKTMRPEVFAEDSGGFSGAFSLDKIKRNGRAGTAVGNRRLRNESEAVDGA